jgi:hypothetical protein
MIRDAVAAGASIHDHVHVVGCMADGLAVALVALLLASTLGILLLGVLLGEVVLLVE